MASIILKYTEAWHPIVPTPTPIFGRVCDIRISEVGTKHSTTYKNKTGTRQPAISRATSFWVFSFSLMYFAVVSLQR
jgi:hypothetical protein